MPLDHIEKLTHEEKSIHRCNGAYHVLLKGDLKRCRCCDGFPVQPCWWRGLPKQEACGSGDPGLE